jgi:hypothetical protein
METFNIHQLIYTKLNQSDSPFQKKDFHTAFYPLDFLTKTEQLVIENFIFIPEIENFNKKQVVYFREFKSEIYLFVLDIKSLPNEVDEFGRKGIFLCHVFLFPEKLWKLIPQPNKLLQFVEKYTFNSRKELLESSFINRQTGNIQAIQISEEIFNKIEKNFSPIDDEADKFVLKYLFDCLDKNNNNFKLVYKSNEEKANLLFNKMICYFPNSVKHKIGWDTSYEGGRMMDFSIPLAAFEQKAPKGGSQIVAIQGNPRINPPENFTKFEIEKPFEKWIFFSTSTINSHQMIEDGLLLAQTLETGKPHEINNISWDITNFCISNLKLLERRFYSKCKSEFDRKIAGLLLRVMSPSDKMYFILNKIEDSKVTEYLVEALQRKKISHRRLKKNISRDYIIKSPILILLEQLWNTNVFNLELFNKLSESEKFSLNAYIVKTKWLYTKSYLEIIKNNQVLLGYFRTRYEKPKKIIKYFSNNFSMSMEDLLKLGFFSSDINRIFKFWIKNKFKKEKTDE